MANNKVQLSDGTVLLDLTGDTVTPETLMAGVIAHNAAGEPIVGEATSGGMKPATLTLTSSDYQGNRYGTFMFVNSEGHADWLQHSFSPFTFPVTVKTVIGGVVVFIPNGFPGIPSYLDLIGGECLKYSATFYILVTSPQASINIYNSD